MIIFQKILWRLKNSWLDPAWPRYFLAGSFETGGWFNRADSRIFFPPTIDRYRSIDREREKKANETRGNEIRDRGAMMIDSVPKDDSGKSICRAAPLSFRQLHNVPPTKHRVVEEEEKKKKKRDGKRTRPDIEPVASILFREIFLPNGRKIYIKFLINLNR